MKKRGQFYFIATIIIVLLIVSFAAVTNYAVKKESAKLYDFGEALGVEAENVIDYGISQGEDLETLLTDFVEDYADYIEEGIDLYFIFGNKDKIIAIAYQDISSEDVYITSGTIIEELVSGVFTIIENPSGNKIVITIGDDDYEFKLKTGENFYFVVSQEIGDETYVVTN